jgi:carbonic anhydrase/acetyltransferase-like protein (isoleucine patch superfamily)
MTIRTFKGKHPNIHPSAYIDESALVIGDVHIGEDCSVWPMAVIRGDVHRIEIGAQTNIQDGCVLHVTHDSDFKPGGSPLIVGNGVTIGHNVVLHACTLEDFCLIGIGAVILDGAVIRARAMVGAGTLVPPGKELDGGFLWVGRPAKSIRALEAKEMAYLEYTAAHYVRLKNSHRATDF